MKESGEGEMVQDEVREGAAWVTRDLEEEEGFVSSTMGEPLEDFFFLFYCSRFCHTLK